SDARSALAGESQMLAGADAARDAHVELALLRDEMAARIDRRHRQPDRSPCATVRVLEVDQHLRVMILPLARHRLRPPLLRPCLSHPFAEQCLEEVAVVARLAVERAAAELEAGVPVGGRLEVLPGAPV